VAEETRIIDLDDVRADGWFERLASQNEAFEQLCEVVGQRFVAFSIIAGVRITALSIDQRVPDASLVDFVLGETGQEQRLSLGEFRRRLVAAILSRDPPPPEELQGDMDSDDIQELIGFRYVLLAPLFGVELRELHVGSTIEESRVLCRVGEEEEIVPLETLKQALRERVRAEVDRSSTGSPFSIDLAVIPEVQEAADADDHDRVVELLGAWPGPLSLLLRTAEGQRLSADVRETLARSLGHLGTAYAETGRTEWAGEVLRLGIQWAQDGPVAGDLFRRMGVASVAGGRHGQAIGLLRRALSLGVDPKDVVPHLCRSYAARGKYVAAMLCAEEAVALGENDDETDRIMEVAAAELGEAWAAFREAVPAPHQSAETIPAPPPEES
jgi:hypothetical protein